MTEISENEQLYQRILFVGYRNKIYFDSEILEILTAHHYEIDFLYDFDKLCDTVIDRKSNLVIIDMCDVLISDVPKRIGGIDLKVNILVLVGREDMSIVRDTLSELSNQIWVLEMPLDKQSFLTTMMRAMRRKSPANDEVTIDTFTEIESLEKKFDMKNPYRLQTRANSIKGDNSHYDRQESPETESDSYTLQGTEHQDYSEPVSYTNRIMSKLSEILFMTRALCKSGETIPIDPPLGMILTGEHQEDKLDIIRSIVDQASSKLYYINCKEILCYKKYGEPEEYIRQTFQDAKNNGKLKSSIIYLDQVENLLSTKGPFDISLIDRIIGQLLLSMNSLSYNDKIFVVASVKNMKSLDKQLRSRGHFDIEVFIDSPTEMERLSILQQLTASIQLGEDVSLFKVASITKGLGKSEIHDIVRKAGAHALEQYIERKHSSEVDYPKGDKSLNVLDDNYILDSNQVSKTKIAISMGDFIFSMRIFKDSKSDKRKMYTMSTNWEELGGYSETIKEIREALEWPLKYPNLFKSLDISSPKGILLYGPPGNGKTKIARAIHSNFSQATFFNVKGPELISKWIGESELALRDIFQQARDNTPSIIFIDEIDSIAPPRSSEFDKSEVMNRMVSQLLIEMDGLESLDGVTVIGATNRIDSIDKALLRPGRFDKLIYIPPPSKEDRLEILKILTKKVRLSKEVDLDIIANQTENYSGADLYGLIMEAKKESLREYILSKDVRKLPIRYTADVFMCNDHIAKAKKKSHSLDRNKEELSKIDAYR